MYNLNIFDKNNMQITWCDIYYGIKNNLLDLKCVSDFAVRCLERNETNNQEIVELAWQSEDKDYLLKKISNIIKQSDEFSINQSELKWQYCIVKNLKIKQMEFDDLSNKLDELYASFNYPEDMEEFISYMPIKDNYDPTIHTREENMERIFKKIDEFLNKKLREIG